jgi:metal-dependent amidase/aminoacylase/carboxypeptidase family protein
MLKMYRATITRPMLETIKQLRKELHQHPELSGQERETASRIRNFVAHYQPTEIITGLGGHGVAVVYDFPDDLIETGITMFTGIIERILQAPHPYPNRLMSYRI